MRYGQGGAWLSLNGESDFARTIRPALFSGKRTIAARRARERVASGSSIAAGSWSTSKALFFDVFGTVVDWRTSIARETEPILKPLGHSLDWFHSPMRGAANISPRWKKSVPASCRLPARRPAPAEPGAHPAALRRVGPRRGDVAQPQSRLASARRLAGRAARHGCAQAEILAGAGLQRQHLADGRCRAPQRPSPGMRSSGRRSRATSSRSRASISPPAKRSALRPATA